MNLRLHKLLNWEYWPVYIVYMPTFFYWLFLMLKFRSIKFFKYANPYIKNGGFYGDSKFEIYNMLPQEFIPKTLLIKKKYNDDPKLFIAQHNYEYPLIAKPDIGLRGIGVEKLYTEEELIKYHNSSKGNYLIQELIEFPNEIGLFYIRIPNQDSGIITGITIKNFLEVTGNGVDNIKKLLSQNPRHEMQISKLQLKMNLNEVLEEGQKRCLVPFGNHNRGTEFLDGKYLINEQLENSINNILSKIPGFYYGRLDIRYNSIEELTKGKNFKIIELNGVKSEPTHIYDPMHSFWYGQREIFRHQVLMGKISLFNFKRTQN